MNQPHLTKKLLAIAEEKIIFNDPAHDFIHAKRVMENAELLAKKEGGDLEVVIPAALFHNLIDYPKNDPRVKNSKKESAEATAKILKKIKGYPAGKIEQVKAAIMACTGPREVNVTSLEGNICRDADDLEITGAMAILRAFISAGTMKRKICDLKDPFCRRRNPDGLQYTLDYLLTKRDSHKEFYTKTARVVARQRNIFLKQFIKELEKLLK